MKKKCKRKVLASLIFLVMVFNILFLAITSHSEEFNDDLAEFVPDEEVIEINNFTLIGLLEENLLGRFILSNKGALVYPQLWVEYELYVEGNYGEPNLLSYKTQEISMNKNELKGIEFSLKLPEILPQIDENTNHFLIITITDRIGNSYAINFTELHNLGVETDSFVFYDYSESQFLGHPEGTAALTGPTYKPDETAYLALPVKSFSQDEFEVVPYMEIYERDVSFNSQPVYRGYTDQIFTLGSNEEKSLEIEFPMMEDPESYLVKMALFDMNGNQLSGIIRARYVISGISAKITSSFVNYNNETEELEFLIGAVGPADGSSLENALISINVRDSKGNQLIRESEFVDIDHSVINANTSIPYNESETMITLEIEIEKDGKVLDSIFLEYNIEDLMTEQKDIQIPSIYEDDEFWGKNNPPSTPEGEDEEDLTSIPEGEDEKDLTSTPDGEDEKDLTSTPDGEDDRGFGPNKPPFSEYSEEEPIISDLPVPYDVEETLYEDSVSLLVNLGVVKGYEDGSFRPNRNISRAEFVTMAYKLKFGEISLESDMTDSKFDDVDENHWAYEFINAGVKLDLLKGYEDGTFKPDRNISYAEAYTVAVRMTKTQEELESMVNWQWPQDYISAAVDMHLTRPSMPSIERTNKEMAVRGNIAMLLEGVYYLSD